jgi:hypothetical protein
MEIKKGDLVRAIGHGCDVTKGKKYEVTGVKTYDDGDIMAIEFYDDKYDHRIIGLSSFEKVEGMAMTKSNLKNGMVVEYSIGLDDDKFAMVLNDNLVDLTGFMELKMYNEDLFCEVNNDFDIIAVYEVENDGHNLIDILKGKTLKKLWQREEVKEMTVEDIEKVVGHKVKVIGEDK